MASLVAWFTAATACAQAPIPPGIVTESLEWMILDSEVIVVGRIGFATPDEPLELPNRVRADLLIEVREVLKGAVKLGEPLRISWTGPGRAPLARGVDVLICLEGSAGGSNFSFMPYRYILLNNQVPVTQMNFERLQKREEILAAARRLTAQQPGMPLKPQVIFTPGYGMHLRVPIDQRLEELARQWLNGREMKNRMLGVQAIKPFKSPENLSAVRRLLDDTRAFNDHGHWKWKRGFYAVRADACDLLGDWGEPIPDLPLGGQILRYEPVSLSKIFIGIIAIAVGWMITYLVLRRRREGLAAQMARWTLLSLPLALAALAGFYWIRSHGRVDELLLTPKASQYQIASYHGGIQCLVAKQWPRPHGLALGSFDRTIHQEFWSLGRMSLTSSKKVIGFAVAQGQTLDADGNTHPFTLFRLPYWLLVIPGALVILKALFILLRRWRRTRRGLCRDCGYDLRENPAGKCPECGAALPARLEAGDKVPIGGKSIGV